MKVEKGGVVEEGVVGVGVVGVGVVGVGVGVERKNGVLKILYVQKEKIIIKYHYLGKEEMPGGRKFQLWI